jgi:hypothetical protein
VLHASKTHVLSSNSLNIGIYIEEPRGKPQGIFDRKEFYLFFIRSLTPQQGAENALAIAVLATRPRTIKIKKAARNRAAFFIFGSTCS